MNFLLDNNLPPALARALHELSKHQGHTVVPLRDKFAIDTDDITWINTLKAEGNWTILSQDQFRKSDLEKQAIRDCGLIVFSLARQWSRFSYWEKATNLVRWWPAIIDQSDRISGGAAFRVPWRYISQGRFEQVKMK